MVSVCVLVNARERERDANSVLRRADRHEDVLFCAEAELRREAEAAQHAQWV
jgi:hypothetical protein